MRLGDERITYLTHMIINSLWGDELVDFESEERVIAEVKRVFFQYFKAEEAADEYARGRIASLSRNVPIGSNEYNVLYEKYYLEEMNRRRA